MDRNTAGEAWPSTEWLGWLRGWAAGRLGGEAQRAPGMCGSCWPCPSVERADGGGLPGGWSTAGGLRRASPEPCATYQWPPRVYRYCLHALTYSLRCLVIQLVLQLSAAQANEDATLGKWLIPCGTQVGPHCQLECCVAACCHRGSGMLRALATGAACAASLGLGSIAGLPSAAGRFSWYLP